MGLRIGGLISGLDTNALIESLLTLERRPLQLAEQRKADLKSEQALFRDLNTKLLALREAAAGLDNLSTGLTGPAVAEEFLSYSATSSDDSVVTATATGEASPGSLDITVTSLAQAARRITTRFASESDVIAAEGETLEIDYGGAAPIAITVGAGGASLVDLRGLINSDLNNDGTVFSDVIDDGTGFRLVISGTETGADKDIALTTNITNGAAAFLDPAVTQPPAQDAVLEVFGIQVTRPTNTVTDLIPGVSLELNAVTTEGPVEIAVAIDEETIGAELDEFVSAYNGIVEFIREQTSVDAESGNAGPLSGDSTLRNVQQTIQRILTGAPEFAGNPLRSLSQAGLSLDRDGLLSLDSEALSEALAAGANDIRQLLSGDGTVDGLATALVRALDPITKATPSQSDPNVEIPGLLTTRIEGFDTRIESLDTQITRIEARLEKREELLVAQFTQLESTIAALQQQGNALTGL